MLQLNGYPIKINQNIIRKAILRKQNPDAKAYLNQQEFTKNAYFFKLQLLIVSSCKSKEMPDFLHVYDIKLMMSYRNFTTG